MEKKNRSRLVLVFKPETRHINPKVMAGAERVFFNDAIFLSHKYNTTLYSSAKLSFDSTLSIRCFVVKIPSFFIDLVAKEFSLKSTVTKKIHKIIVFFIEFLYCMSILFKERKKQYYVFQLPLIALIFPKQTTLMYQNFTANLYFYSLLKNRYQQLSIIVCSEDLKLQFISHYPELKNIVVLYNGVDPSIFKKKLDLEQTKIISFCFPSVWHKNKGIGILISAIKQLPKKILHKSMFTFAGGSTLWYLHHTDLLQTVKYEKLLRTLGKKSGNIILKPNLTQTELATLFQQSTYTLVPSTWREPFGNVIVESMMSGTPVIGFHRGSLPEIIRSPENGYLIQRCTATSLRNMLIKVINNFEVTAYTRQSEAAHHTAITNFSYEHRSKKLLQLLNNTAHF
jgi:glycosyltransferase involved in cell wall biosynthesis